MNLQTILRRLFTGVAIVFVISFVTFVLLDLAPGNNAAAYYGGTNAQLLTQAELDRITKAFNLDQPVWHRYGAWLSQALQGNLGMSIRMKRPVTEILAYALPNTALLAGVSVMVIVLLSVILGLRAGMRPQSAFSQWVSYGAIVTSAIPMFWVGLLLMYIFAIKLQWLPSSGTHSYGGGDFQDRLRHLILPSAVLVFGHVGAYARVLRENIIKERQSYYVLVGQANGLSEKYLQRQILKNSLTPYLNYLGMTIPGFFAGSIIVESLFTWSGLGHLLVEAVSNKDYPVLMGGVLTIASLVVVVMMVTDAINSLLNPWMERGSDHV